MIISLIFRRMSVTVFMPDAAAVVIGKGIDNTDSAASSQGTTYIQMPNWPQYLTIH
jgi:hypothetical protein